jgi:hypothetical protein
VSACKALGADTVHVLFQGSADEADTDVTAIEQAGGIVLFNAGITRLFGEENRLQEIEYMDRGDMTAHRIPAQTLILASGRFPEVIFIQPAAEEAEEAENPETAAADSALAVPRKDWEGVLPYKEPDHAHEIGLLAKGDPLTDMSAAIRAIASGRRGAASIHQVMYGFEIALPDLAVTPDSEIQNVHHLEGVPASTSQIMPVSGEMDEAAETELEIGFTEEMARTEADRCLQCGLICYQREWAQPIAIEPPRILESPVEEKVAEPAAAPETISVSDVQRIQ